MKAKKKKKQTKKQKSKLAMVENNFLEFEKYLKSCNWNRRTAYWRKLFLEN